MINMVLTNYVSSNILEISFSFINSELILSLYDVCKS